MKNESKEWTKKFWIAVSLLSVTILLLLFQALTSCSSEKKKDDGGQAVAGCDGLSLGQTAEEECQGGSRISVCTLEGLKETVNTCDGAVGENCVSYDNQISQLFDQTCGGCHAELEQFQTAKDWASKIQTRVNLPPEDRGRMPLAPRAPLNADQKKLVADWIGAGTPRACLPANGNGGSAGKFLDINLVNTSILQAFNRVDKTEQKDYRCLISSHKLNEGQAANILAQFAQAGAKTLNSVNIRSGQAFKLDPIPNSEGTIMCFDQRDFGLDGSKWDLIERGDKLRLVDNTSVGQLIQILAGTDRPWFHVDNFIDITQRNADVYYGLLEIPLKLSELVAKLGVDFAQDLEDFDAVFAGGNQSPISLLKNRLIVRFESDDGYFWITYDPVDLNGVRERNLFEFPLLFEVGGQRIFNFDASEVIFTLKNGLQGYGLYAAEIIRDGQGRIVRVDGNRANAAPLNIVADNISPITPEIKNAISCHRCHSEGIIPMPDQIRNHVLTNASGFPVADVDAVEALYDPQPVLDQIYRDDQQIYADALTRIGVDPKAGDSINAVSDKYLGDWDVNRTASFLLYTEQQLKDCINRSAIAKNQIGQLLTGGTITYNQFVEVLPVIKQDCRLFQDPLD